MNQNKIYIGSLPYSTTTADVTNLCGEFGELDEVKLITDRDTGQSKGFGFVTFKVQQAAEVAIKRLNGKEMNGRALTVNMAKARTEKKW